MLTLAVLAAYAIALGFVLHLLVAARRCEEARGRLRAVPDPPAAAVLGAHAGLGRLVATVQDTLAAEQVTVVVTDDAEPGTGVVAACVGAPGLLGNRVRVLPEPVSAFLTAGEAAALGLAGQEPWAFVHLPIPGPLEPAGALTVAARRAGVFGRGDLRMLERLAREGAPEFDRRRHALIPRALVE
jgi:hypothetical protein